MTIVRAGERLIGGTEPCFLVAEVGINHNGDLKLAHQLIDAAVDAGCDAVKFQNYRTREFLYDHSLTHEYKVHGRTIVESQFELFRRCELGSDALSELCEHCHSQGVIFFSTATSVEGINELVRLGVPLLKNGSDCLQHLKLIRAMAQTGLPCVISTGMGSREDIDDAVQAFREAGGSDIILLVCTSLYPTPLEEANVRRIPALATAFNVPVGFSDHTQGVEAAIAAVALGACMIEKHFTLDKNTPGPDHYFSADPVEFKALVSAVRKVEKSLGHSTIGPTPTEMTLRQHYRLSCVAACDLPAGHRLQESDISFSRPGTGMLPKAEASLLGKLLTKSVPIGHVFKTDDFAA